MSLFEGTGKTVFFDADQYLDLYLIIQYAEQTLNR